MYTKNALNYQYTQGLLSPGGAVNEGGIGLFWRGGRALCKHGIDSSCRSPREEQKDSGEKWWGKEKMFKPESGGKDLI